MRWRRLKHVDFACQPFWRASDFAIPLSFSFGFLALLSLMAPKKVKAEKSKCKWCHSCFLTAPNPLTQNPPENDLLKRRSAGSLECRPCANMYTASPDYSHLSRKGLEEHLLVKENMDQFLAARESWCEKARAGKRTSKNNATSAENATYAETASSFETKQVVGFLWPVALLKAHGKPIPKKLQVIQHQGAPVKGAVLVENVVGAIELASTSSKTAKRVVETGRDDSDQEGEADAAFVSMQKRLRVTGAANEDKTEISVKFPTKANLDDVEGEMQMLLWGDGPASSSCKASVHDRGGVSSGDESAATRGTRHKSKKSRNKAPKKEGGDLPSGTSSAAGGDADADASMWALSLTAGVAKRGRAGKVAAAESRELDKSETIILLAQQMKNALEDSRQIMGVTVSKASAMKDKVEARLSEDSTKLLSETIRREGTSCRAAVIWQNLKDCATTLAGITDFVEALHDEEAAPATLRSRAAAIGDLGVKLPPNVKSVICRRAVDELVQQSAWEQVFTFLDPRGSASDGIAQILPAETPSDKVDDMCHDFQVGCITQSVGKLLLRGQEDAGQGDQVQAMTASANQLWSFIKAFRASNIIDKVAPDKSNLLEDMCRLQILARICVEPGLPAASECDSIEAAKSVLTKTKSSPFYCAVTVLPVGVFLCATAAQKVCQARLATIDVVKPG